MMCCDPKRDLASKPGDGAEGLGKQQANIPVISHCASSFLHYKWLVNFASWMKNSAYGGIEQTLLSKLDKSVKNTYPSGLLWLWIRDQSRLKGSVQLEAFSP